MNPGWLLKTLSPSSFIRRNAFRASSELRSTLHLPMVQRRYVTAPPGLLLCYGHHDNRSFEGGVSSEMAYFGAGSHRDDPIHPSAWNRCSANFASSGTSTSHKPRSRKFVRTLGGRRAYALGRPPVEDHVSSRQDQ